MTCACVSKGAIAGMVGGDDHGGESLAERAVEHCPRGLDRGPRGEARLEVGA
jgi:hypothetical protein